MDDDVQMGGEDDEWTLSSFKTDKPLWHYYYYS
jgi:hypothetical protein